MLWCRHRSHAEVKGHLRLNVKVYLQDFLVTINFATVNPIVSKLGSQVHLGNRCVAVTRSHAKAKGH